MRWVAASTPMAWSMRWIAADACAWGRRTLCVSITCVSSWSTMRPIGVDSTVPIHFSSILARHGRAPGSRRSTVAWATNFSMYGASTRCWEPARYRRLADQRSRRRFPVKKLQPHTDATSAKAAAYKRRETKRGCKLVGIHATRPWPRASHSLARAKYVASIDKHSSRGPDR